MSIDLAETDAMTQDDAAYERRQKRKVRHSVYY